MFCSYCCCCWVVTPTKASRRLAWLSLSLNLMNLWTVSSPLPEARCSSAAKQEAQWLNPITFYMNASSVLVPLYLLPVP